MADAIQVSGPVEIESSAKERVAYDLMQRIAMNAPKEITNKGDEKYWFTLYRKCYKAASGYPLAKILEAD